MTRFHVRRRTSPTPVHRSCRPRIEALEDRVTPATSLVGVVTLPFFPGNSPVADKSHVVVTDGPAVDQFGNLFETDYITKNIDNIGTVFEVPVGSTELPPALAGFFASRKDGQPNTHLIMDSSGNLYGTTASGGQTSDGTVFEVLKGGGTPTTLDSFNNTNTGYDPGDLLLSGGVLYGTTNAGGKNGDGTVFSLALTSGAKIKTLATFNGTNGNGPDGGLIISNGILYGTTKVGGKYDEGTVFSVPAAGGDITTLAAFSGFSPGGGAGAGGHLVLSNGALLGTNAIGDGSKGSVFRVPITPRGKLFSVPFNASGGGIPVGGLIDDGGTIVGITGDGGTGGGSVFKVDPTSLAITTLETFTHHGDSGIFPFGSLSVDSKGNIYGASQASNQQTTVLWKLSGLSVSQLAFVKQPRSVQVNQTMPPVTVAAPTDSQVILTLNPNPQGETLTESSTSFDGVATFPDLSFSKPGTYTLKATSGTRSVLSDSFTVSQAVQTNFVWTGLGNGNWSDPKDWAGGLVAPKAGHTVNLSFPATAKKPINTDDIAGLEVGTLLINQTYTLQGSKELTLNGLLTVNAPPAGPGLVACHVNMPLKLVGNVTATVKDGEVDFGGVIDGDGITIVGPGTLQLGSLNTYTGNTVLKSGTLRVASGLSPLGIGGTLELEGGTLDTTATGELTLENPVSVSGSVTVDSAGLSQMSLSGNVQVTKTSVLTLSHPLTFTKSLSVSPKFVLTIQGDGNLKGGLSGHVEVISDPTPEHMAFVRGVLATGAELDVPKGSIVGINGTLRGSGAMNIAGELSCLTANHADLGAYNGTVTLQPGGILLLDTALGVGKLQVNGGTIATVGGSVDLSVAMQATLSGNVTFDVSTNSHLGFHGPVTVSHVITATLQGSLGKGQGGAIDFSQNIVFSNGKLMLTFAGSGTVRLHVLNPQQVKKGPKSQIKLTPGG
jgi:uncharacterized repeat protein (TIGR03803 family)/autotransporter-associated beta strand protein